MRPKSKPGMQHMNWFLLENYSEAEICFTCNKYITKFSFRPTFLKEQTSEPFAKKKLDLRCRFECVHEHPSADVGTSINQ